MELLNLRMQRATLSLLSRDCSMIQIQKTPMIPDFYLSRQVSPLLQNSTLRRVFEFLLAIASGLSVDALRIPGFSSQSDGSRMRNLSRQLMSGSSPIRL